MAANTLRFTEFKDNIDFLIDNLTKKHEKKIEDDYDGKV